MKRLFGTKHVIALGIGTALFVALTNVQIPLVIIPNTSMHTRCAVLALFAAAFGPIVGALMGFLGHAVGDVVFYGAIQWSWVFPEAILGCILGLFFLIYGEDEGKTFSMRTVTYFNFLQIIANTIAWGIVAPILDIVIYSEPPRKVFLQGVFAVICNVIVIGVLGSFFLLLYSQIVKRFFNHNPEDEEDF